MNEDQRQLCEANYPLIYAFAKKYCKYPSQFEEVVFYATNGYVNACRLFDPTKGFKFSTFAYKCMYHELVNFYKRVEKDSQHISLDVQDEGFRESVANYLVSDDEIAEDTLIDDERDDLFHRIKLLIHRYFFGDKVVKQSDLSKQFNLSQSHLSFLENEAKKKIKNDLLK